MKVFDKLFRFYIHSSIHLSLAVVALVALTYLYFHLPIDYNLSYFVFFGSISGYNFIKYFEISHRKLKIRKKSFGVIRILTLAAALLCLYFFFYLEYNQQIWVFICGVLTVLYALPIFPKGKNLRKFNGLKVFIIATVCTLVTSFLPLLDSKYDNTLFFILLQRFVFIIVVLLPFEIRDMNIDSISLGTIPQKIGVNKTKWIGVVLLLFFMWLSVIINHGEMTNLMSDLIVAVVAAGFLLFSSTTQKEYFASFWVEAVPIVWLFLFLLVAVL